MRCNQRAKSPRRFPVVRFIGAVAVVGGCNTCGCELDCSVVEVPWRWSRRYARFHHPKKQKPSSIISNAENDRYAHYTPSIMAYSFVYPHAHSHPHSHRTRPWLIRCRCNIYRSFCFYFCFVHAMYLATTPSVSRCVVQQREQQLNETCERGRETKIAWNVDWSQLIVRMPFDERLICRWLNSTKWEHVGFAESQISHKHCTPKTVQQNANWNVTRNV